MGASKIQMIYSTDNKIQQLSDVRILACIAIVTLHTVFAANEYFKTSITSGQNMASQMVENNMMWAVPCFLMVTGVLHLNRRKQITWKKLYGKYILRIAVALVGCCILFRIFDMIMDGEAFTFAGVMYAFIELATGTCWGHLWYLYLLIGLYVLMPFYKIIADHCTDKELLYLCGAYVLFVSLIPLADSLGFHIAFYISESIIYPLYLFAGHMIYEKRMNLNMSVGIGLIVLCTGLILLFDYMKFGLHMEVPGQLFKYSSPLVIGQTLGVFTVLIHMGEAKGRLTAKTIQVLDDTSFGTYLLHMMFVRLLFRYMQFDPYLHVPALTLAAVVLGIYLLSTILTFVLRVIPGVNKIL